MHFKFCSLTQPIVYTINKYKAKLHYTLCGNRRRSRQVIMYKPHHFSAKCMLKTLHCVSTFFDFLQLYFSILKYVGQHLFFGAVNIFSIHRAAGRSAIVQNSCMKSKKRLILRKSTYIYYSPNTIFLPSTVTLYCELKSVI